MSCASVLVSSGHSARMVQSSLSLKEQSVKLPKAVDLQKEAEKAQKNLIEAIHQAQLTEAKRIAARSLTRINAGFSSVFSKIAMMLDVGVHQALPLDITLKSDQVNEALAKRTSATHSITHAMAYLANYTLNYTLTAGASVFTTVEAVPPGEPKFTWASEPPLEEDEAFSFYLPAKGEKDQAEAVPFAPMPVPLVQAGKTIDAKDAKNGKADCAQCPKCAECLEATSETMQDSAVDAIEVALEAEVKRMGATVFQNDPKAEVEFLCKFNKYTIENHFRGAHPLVHPSEHEQPISSDKTASFRSFLQMYANKVEECPSQPPSIASLDDAAHVAQQEVIQKIFLAQYHEIVRSVNRGLVRLQAATDAEGWHTGSTQMKSFDNKKWNGEFQKFLLANPIKRWAWNYKPEKKEKK